MTDSAYHPLAMPNALLYARELAEKAWENERAAWRILTVRPCPAAADLQAWHAIKADALRAQERFDAEFEEFRSTGGRS